MESTNEVQLLVLRHFSDMKIILDSLVIEDIQLLIEYLANARAHGHFVFVIGNGGSAASASHLACDLGRIAPTRPSTNHADRFKVMALNDNVPWLTALANDMSYESVFAEMLRNLANKDDLLIVITASGNSPNIVEAVKVAKELKLKSIGLLGFDGGAVKESLDHYVHVHSNKYSYVEDVHMIVIHLVTAYFQQH